MAAAILQQNGATQYHPVSRRSVVACRLAKPRVRLAQSERLANDMMPASSRRLSFGLRSSLDNSGLDPASLCNSRRDGYDRAKPEVLLWSPSWPDCTQN
jgi:hypothetical protein